MLSDEDKRKKYDQFGHQGLNGNGHGHGGGGFHFNFDDFFRNFDFNDDFDSGPFHFSFGGGNGHAHHGHHGHHGHPQQKRAGFFSFGDFFNDVSLSNIYECL